MVELDYPTTYVFKVMGKREGDFVGHVRSLFDGLMVEPLPEQAFSEQDSRKGTYASISVTVMLTSEDQRRRIYAALHQDPAVVYYL